MGKTIKALIAKRLTEGDCIMDKEKCVNISEGSQPNYREKIVELVEKIENPAILKFIYGFVKSGYKEEKAGSE